MLGEWIKQCIADSEKQKYMSFKDICALLSKFKNLQKGWYDGLQGEPILNTFIDCVHKFLYNLAYETPIGKIFIYPMLNGGIRAEFDWHGWCISIEFYDITKPAYLHASTLGNDKPKQFIIPDWYVYPEFFGVTEFLWAIAT